jgi:DNA-binding response OmpR family regulator
MSVRSPGAPDGPKAVSQPTASARADAPVILVVEDDRDIRSMIAKGLGLTYTVYEAHDGQHALEVLATIATPVAIVCDVNMPRLDGLSLARQLKKDAQKRAIPIVFLTAKSSPLDVIEGINAGARHYLTKPFKMTELIDKVDAVTGAKKR